MIPWNEQFAEDFWLLLYPGMVIPCQSLREIRYTYRKPLGPLIDLARERKRAGHQLGSVWLLTVHAFDENRAEELREHGGSAREMGSIEVVPMSFPFHLDLQLIVVFCKRQT